MSSTPSKPHFIGNSDGACRFSQGHASYAAILKDQFGTEYVSKGYLSKVSNNVAEYRGLIAALQLATDHKAHSLRMRMDSELIVRQIKGMYRVTNEGLKPLYEECRAYIALLPFFTIEHVYRENNQEADALANEVIDAHIAQERSKQ